MRRRRASIYSMEASKWRIGPNQHSKSAQKNVPDRKSASRKTNAGRAPRRSAPTRRAARVRKTRISPASRPARSLLHGETKRAKPEFLVISRRHLQLARPVFPVPIVRPPWSRPATIPPAGGGEALRRPTPHRGARCELLLAFGSPEARIVPRELALMHHAPLVAGGGSRALRQGKRDRVCRLGTQFTRMRVIAQIRTHWHTCQVHHDFSCTTPHHQMGGISTHLAWHPSCESSRQR